MSSTDGLPSEHYTVLIEEAYKTASLRFLTRMYETVKNMSNALHCVQATVSELHEDVLDLLILTKRHCVEVDGSCILGDGAGLSLQ